LGWAAGDSSIILHTTNGGQDWIKQFSYVANSSLNSIFFIDEFNGWAAGRGDLFPVLTQIWKTTDGGNNWNLQEWGSSPLQSVYFANDQVGWTVGGLIYKSTNGGENWSPQVSPDSSINSIYFLDENIGWAVGNNGVILHTTTGGVVSVEGELEAEPATYYLSHNFPDPFNPSTKIRYTLPQTSNVVIKIFDVLGNEIETLVNEERPVGTYEITWYAEGLPSGVYFYQLKAGNYIDTKKMILLK